jgi:hypothetical protein
MAHLLKERWHWHYKPLCAWVSGNISRNNPCSWCFVSGIASWDIHSLMCMRAQMSHAVWAHECLNALHKMGTECWGLSTEKWETLYSHGPLGMSEREKSTNGCRSPGDYKYLALEFCTLLYDLQFCCNMWQWAYLKVADPIKKCFSLAAAVALHPLLRGYLIPNFSFHEVHYISWRCSCHHLFVKLPSVFVLP